MRQNVLFRDLSSRELRYLEKIVHIRHFEPGETVFEQNERGLGMYIIAEGKIAVLVSRAKQNAAQGGDRDLPITCLEEGSFFGEQSLIEHNSKRTATAVAVEPTRLIAFLKPDLLNIVQRRPGLGIKITLQLARVLGKRLRKTTEKLSEIATTMGQQQEDGTDEEQHRNSA